MGNIDQILMANEKIIREFYKQIRQGKLTVREVKTRLKKLKTTKGRPKYYEYKFEAPEKDFILKIKFRKTKVGQSDIINALSTALRSLK